MLFFQAMSNDNDHLNNSVNNRGYLFTVLVALIILYTLYEMGKDQFPR
jgi:hypothetical protein